MQAAGQAGALLHADQRYTACYCEENVWHLVQALLRGRGDEQTVLVAFISNPAKQVAARPGAVPLRPGPAACEQACGAKVPLWCQRAGSHPQAPVVWDYHVLALVLLSAPQRPTVYDLDRWVSGMVWVHVHTHACGLRRRACSTLAFPCPFDEWAERTLRPDVVLAPEYARCRPCS